MEKTSREYAEKLAIELYPISEKEDNELFIKVQKWCIDSCIDGYLKAVEETNVKELREALEEFLTWHKEVIVNNGGHPHIQKAINALNKTK